MNNIYKSIWNSSLGSWVAVSEIANTQGKSSKRGKTSKVVGAFALTLLSAATNSAWAGVCEVVAGVVTGITCVAIGDTTIDVTDKSIRGQIGMVITGGKATLNVSDSDMQITGVGYGATVQGDGAAINFKGNNTVNLSSGNTAILAQNRVGASAGVSVNISGIFNLANSSAGAANNYELDGVELLNRAGGNTDLIFNGNGKVEVMNGNALFVKNYGAANTGTINVTGVNGAVELVTTGDGASGIFALNGVANKTGDLNITTDAKITTSGAGDVNGGGLGLLDSNGIVARILAADSTGKINITNSGAISTLGAKGTGIRAETAGTGLVTINNSGKINTTGKTAHGIQSTTNGGGARIINTEDIATTADGAHGITSTETGTGVVTINNQANISTSGSGSHGILAAVKNGDVDITNSGDIKTQSLEDVWGTSSKGISVDRNLYGAASNAGGNISITSTGGTIETGKTKGSHGISVDSNAASGDINVDLADTNLIVNSSNASGIHINESLILGALDKNSTTSVNVLVGGGSIQVKPAADLAGSLSSSYGIFVEKNAAIISHGDINITNGAAITVENAAANTGSKGGGISATISNTSSTGNITVNNSGDIVANPNKAEGINAANRGSGDTNVINSGSITIEGDLSNGIRASSTGALKVVNSGKIVMTGQDGDGINTSVSGAGGGKGRGEVINTGEITVGYGSGIVSRAYDGGETKITNEGAITTAGTVSHGLYARAIDGNAIIDNNAAITTAGIGASGIRAAHDEQGESGDLTITTGTNSRVETNAEQADGIHASIGLHPMVSAASGNITINAEGTVTTKGASAANGIYAGILKAGSTGNINVTFSGDKIETTGTGNNHGISALQEGSGSLTINHNGNSISTVGVGAYGINTKSAGAGLVTVTSNGKIETTGAGAHGIYTTTNNGSAVLSNDASIITSGSDASGIRVDQEATATSGDITVTTGENSYLETNNEKADGIHASIGSEQLGNGTVASSGNIVIDAKGSIKTTGAGTAEGIYGAIVKPNSTGNISITFSGDTIETTGTGINRGIYGRQDGSGDLTINHLGNSISTAGDEAHGIHALTQEFAGGAASAGQVAINATGKISTMGEAAHGIFVAASNNTTGIDVKTSGDIAVEGATASAIKVVSQRAGDIVVEHLAGAITSTGNNLVNTGAIRTDAITAGKLGVTATGDVLIKSSGSITTEGANRAAGIYGYNQGSGSVAVTASGNITASATNKAGTAGDLVSLYSYGIGALVSDNANATGGAGVNYSAGTIKTAGDEGHALYAGLYNTKTGTAMVSNSGDGFLITTGKKAYGIWSRDETADGGKALAANMGTISTEGAEAHGMHANSHKGYVEILNSGSITATGDYARGISAAINPATGNFGAATGIVIQVDGGSITTSGYDGTGIRASTTAASGDIQVNMNGTKIKVQNQNSDGIFANNMLNDPANLSEVSNLAINVTTTGGEIITDAGTLVSASNYGIVTEQRGAAAGNTKININGTKISSLAKAGEGKNSAGVMATVMHAGGSGYINVFSTGEVLSQGIERNASAFRLTNFGTGYVQFGNNGKATATGKGASGAYLMSTTGMIDVLLNSDSVIMGGYGVDATAGVSAAGLQLESGVAQQNVNNSGTIGAMSDQAIMITTAAGASSNLSNTGTITGNFDLAKAAGDVSVTNYTGGVVELRSFADTDGDGARDTKAVALSNFGTGATSFINENGATLKLAGFTGETSTATTGEYKPVGALSSSQAGITHAQMLNLKRFENAGLIDLTANGKAGDVLVLSGGSTAGTYGGGKYVSNGGTIRFDTVLNEGGTASLSDVLVLDDVSKGTSATKIRVNSVAGSVGGLTQGEGIKLIEVLGTQDTTAFVLGAPVTYGTSEYLLYSDDGAGTKNGWYLRNYGLGGGGGGGGGYQEFRNPNIGAYLGNQYAASNMFNQNILDRRDNVRAPDQNVWIRANHNQVKTDMLDGLQHAKIKTNLFQLGADVIKHNDIIVGVYAGYGDSSVKNRSNQTGTKADGQVTGYHIGAYGSWIPEESKGPYVDVWGHYGWYKNKLEGASQRYDSVKYDSKGYSLSAEVGYGFELAQDKAGRAWILEPHLQGIYSKLDSDSFLDKNLTYYSDSKSNGVQTRLGARFYGEHTAEGKKGVLPFIEANWLNNGSKNEVRMNYENTSSKVGKNVGEVKVGVQGNVSEKLSLFSHVGAQQGSDSFKRYEFQFGLNYNW